MREKPTLVEMRTPEMYVVADKKTGALRFLDKDSEILLEESGQDRCLIENAPNGGRSRLFFDWKKEKGSMQQVPSVKAESIWKRRRGASPMESKTNFHI